MTDEDRKILISLRARLPIDSFNLEKENCEQPSLYDEVGQWVSEVKAASRTAKEHIEFVKADLSLKIRKDPGSYDVDGKMTEGWINSIITVHADYIGAVKDYIEALKLADDASVLLASTGDRRSSIRDLVQLFIHQYYSKDKVINDADWKENEEAINAIRDQKQADQEDLKEVEVGEI